jgi:hypothetical protein
MRKLQDSKIDSPARTLDIKEQAVTTPVSAFTAGDIAITEDVETTIQEIAIEVLGSPIFITCSFLITPASSTDVCNVTLYRDATAIYESGAIIITSVAGAYCSIISFNITDTPDAGSYTYYLKVETVDDDSTVSQRSMMLLEVKR